MKLLWDGHSVGGVVIGLALFVIFFAGAFALYRGELHQWADPALRAASTEVTSADALVEPILEARPPAEGTDLLFVYPFANRPYVYLGYDAANGNEVAQWISPATGTTLPAGGRSALSDLLYHLHFYYQLGTVGELLSGVVAVFFLFVLVSGLLIHLRKLPKDLHTFRSKKGLRTALTDAHNVLGTIGLPFTVMYAVTGAFFSLLAVILAPYVLLVFDGDRNALQSLAEGVEIPTVEASGVPASMLPLDRLPEQLPASWDGVDPVSIQVMAWGDEAATAVLRGEADGTITRSGTAVLDAVSGDVIAASSPADPAPLPATIDVFGTLHFARFGGPLVKALFFLLTLAASAVILTGNLLWIEIRRPPDDVPVPRLHRVLARLTAGVGAGLVAAIPVLFLTTRLVPIDVDGRMGMETAVFFGTWALLIAGAFAGRSAVGAARWQLALAGGLAVLVPVANGIGTGAWMWASAAAGQSAVFGVDLGFLLGGITLIAIASRLRSGEARPAVSSAVAS